MRLGNLSFKVEYDVDLDDKEMVEDAMNAIYFDLFHAFVNVRNVDDLEEVVEVQEQ